MRWLIGMALVWMATGAVYGEYYRFDTPEKWARWNLPQGLVQVGESGRIQLARFRKDINPVRDASSFTHGTLARGDVAGGIWRAGSGAASGPLVIDADRQTYWQPDLSDPLAKWEIEVDLGRAVLARQIRLYFPDQEGARPLRQFTVYTSTGGTISARDDIFRFESVYQTTLPNFETELVIDLSGRKDTTRVLDAHLDVDLARESGFRTVQYIRVGVDEYSEGAALAEIEVDAVGDNIALGTIERGGRIQTGLVVRDAPSMVDGSMNTYANKFTTFQATTGWKNEGLWWEMDLGAQFWVDGLFAYFIDPGEGASGSSVRNGGTGFAYLYSDGRRTTSGDVDYTALVAEGDEQTPFYLSNRHFRYLFKPRKMRFLFWHGFLTGAEWHSRMPELMLFSSGYPAQVVLRSDFIDLGAIVGDRRPKAIKALHWDAELPAETRLQLRSRSGSSLQEEYAFYDKIGGEITEARYNSLPAVLKGKVDTTLVIGEDWGDWSNVYQATGESFQSESPRRFIQLEAILSTEDPRVAPVLNELFVEYGDALVQDVRGRIVPRQTTPNTETPFTYTLWNRVVDEDRGFDLVRLVAPGGLVDVRDIAVRIGGTAVESQLRVDGDSLYVELPFAVRADSLEIDFVSRVLRNAAVFSAELGHRDEPGLWQSVEPAERRGDTVYLPELVTSDRLIDDLRLSSRVLTPNGDGLGDALEVDFVVYKADGIEPQAHIVDLSGVRRARLLPLARGARTGFRWDGRDDAGVTVPPGLYMLHLDVGASTGSGVVVRTIAVAY